MRRIFYIIGILTLIEIIYFIYKGIENKTKTEIISVEALDVITNPITAKKLRKEIESYHKIGYWNIKQLNKIF